MTKPKIRNPKSENAKELRSHPAVRNYTLFCLAALFLLVVCLANQGFEWLCLAPSLIGGLALLAHWRHGPPLVLLSLAGLFGLPGVRSHWSYAAWSRFQTPTLMDAVLCMAVMAYVSGHCRLLSLTRNVFPPDPRRERGAATQPRSADLVTGREMALLGASLLMWTGLAVMVWATGMADLATSPGRAARPDSSQGPASPLGMVLELGIVWVAVAVLAVVGTAVSYLRWATATPEEQLVFLQDQCWRQTRREQSILNRWLTWARLRAQRKKEAS